jgi:hypothetical protein
MLTAHPLLVPRLRKSRSYTSCHPIAPLWSVTGPLHLFCLPVTYLAYMLLVNHFMLQLILHLFNLVVSYYTTGSKISPGVVSNFMSYEWNRWPVWGNNYIWKAAVWRHSSAVCRPEVVRTMAFGGGWGMTFDASIRVKTKWKVDDIFCWISLEVGTATILVMNTSNQPAYDLN